MKRMRFVSIILIISILFSCVFNSYLSMSHNTHECDIDDCNTCLVVTMARTQTKRLGTIPVATVLVAVLSLYLSIVLKFTYKNKYTFDKDTLVSLHIKLTC